MYVFRFEHKSTKDINHDYYYHFNINSTHLPKVCFRIDFVFLNDIKQGY